ncbi:transcription factor bHLH18-like [Neltuma alba]|uniref:transcription factor bHLH18-like n=1 Tax=Neltuma alba TaxID=207710 RepID=UPI0010A42695|nr:transcription factor bHLH18-like [Prosopis alba]
MEMSWQSWLSDDLNNNVVTVTTTDGGDAAITTPTVDDSGSQPKLNSSSSVLSELAASLSDKPAAPTAVWSPSAYILSFNNSTVLPASMDECAVKSSNNEHQSESGTARGGTKRTLEDGPNNDTRAKQGTKKTRSSSETLDHIMAERKRRQELTEKFIALSATIPGLKKIDKSSILSEAINHVKSFQERVRELEEQNKKISAESSVVLCRKKSNQVLNPDDEMSCDYDNNCFRSSSNNEALPQVEARFLNKEILIRIHSEKQNGIMLNILSFLRNLHFSIISSSALPFGPSTLDITIIAEVGDQCKISVMEVVNKMRMALLKSSENKK